MKQFIAFCVMIVIVIPASAQWLIEGWDEKRTVVVDLMPTNASYQNNYVFFGASRLFSENVVTKGTAPFSTDDKGRISWKINFLQPHLLPAETSHTFYLNLYTENISACSLIFETENGQCLQKRIELPKDKYQVPIEFSLSKNNLTACSGTKPEENGIQLSKLTILLNKRDSTLNYKCIVGECNIFDLQLQRKNAQGAFFYELTRNKKNEAPAYVFKKFGTSYPITDYTSFTNLSIPEYYFIPDSAKLKNADWQVETLRLMKHFLNKYPYFSENNTNKQTVLAQADNIIRADLDFTEKVNRMNSLMKSMHDGHFYIEPANTPRPVMGPLLARKINDDIQVIGIFDEDLKKTIHPGMKIIAVDGVPVNRYIDSLSELYFGSIAERKDAAIARMFYRAASDSVRVQLTEAGDPGTEVMIRFRKPGVVPKNFRTEHFKFIAQNNGWAYLKLNRWALGDWINFFNLGDTLKNMQGIIFDLRGNGGGSEIEAIRIFSCFIKKPAVFCYDTYQKASGPRITAPNKFLDLSHLKIMVLVDGKTACASELFAASLKKNCSATIVGSEPTNGAYANAAYMYLPYGIVVKTNILSKTYLTADRTSIQHKGLQPDLVVNITAYKDLLPYDDKVLKSALMLTTSAGSNTKR